MQSAQAKSTRLRALYTLCNVALKGALRAQYDVLIACESRAHNGQMGQIVMVDSINLSLR